MIYGLAASILPLSTAYSVGEALGDETALDDSFLEAPVFYVTYGLVVLVALTVVLIPGAPLVQILFLSQALNAVLLLPLLVMIARVASDRSVMGEHANGPVASAVTNGKLISVSLVVDSSILAFSAASFSR